jgi:putative tricarboxylic transport membrane protein
LEEINALFHGFAVAMTPFNLMLMFIGVVLGVIIGVLPGTWRRQWHRDPAAAHVHHAADVGDYHALVYLLGCAVRRAITSILFNIPGEPWSVATTFDGYPMAQQGNAGEALTAAFTSSFIGAFVAVVMITFLAPAVAKFALRFGPPEFFLCLFSDVLQFYRHGQRLAVEDARGNDAGLRARCSWHGYHDGPVAAHLRLSRTHTRI